MKQLISIFKKEGVALNIISLAIFFGFILYLLYNPFLNPVKIGTIDCGVQYIHSNNPSITPFEPQVAACFIKAFTNYSKAYVLISDVGTDSGETIEAEILGKEKTTCKIYLHDKTSGMVNVNEKKDIQQICYSIRETTFNGGKALTFTNCH